MYIQDNTCKGYYNVDLIKSMKETANIKKSL